MFYEVIPEGKVGRLTYDFSGELKPGQIVLVPVLKRLVPGVVVKKVAQPNFKTKTIAKILYSEPLPKHLLKTIKFVHEYYLAAEGEGVALILPRGVEKKRREKARADAETSSEQAGIIAERAKTVAKRAEIQLEKTEQNTPKNAETLKKSEIRLNEAQKRALEALKTAPGATKLLFGVTGSGKTNIYLKLAEEALRGGKSAIVLVPEIALTGQLVRVFREIFGEKIVLIHSKQSESERHKIFTSLLHGTEPKIVIGPRSALFAPLKNLGLIVIDEEHETTYIQENAPRYSAIRVASLMARELDIPLVLGSATPNLEDFYLAKKQGSLVILNEKAKKEARAPEVKIMDLKNRQHFSRNRYFSNELLAAIKDNLEHKRQTLIFHNRRGSATMTICENCGEEILCPNCFLPLTLHADKFQLVCHSCGFSEPVPTCCPKCGAAGILHKGFGTKLLETELKKLFPKARIRRFDADNRRGESLEEMYDEVKSGEVDILVGTQTVAKGLDLPKLATVGIVQADAGLSLPDFAAEEKVFQLITQVMGRVGRGHAEKAEVFIQTYRPENPVINFAIRADYLGFAEYLTARRREGGFPPFRFLATASLTMKTERTVIKRVREAAEMIAGFGASSGAKSGVGPSARASGANLRGANSGAKSGFGTVYGDVNSGANSGASSSSANLGFIVSPPMPAFHERTQNGFTWQIIIRAKSRKKLLEVLAKLDKNFKITLDPPGLLG